jgi:hypothetical protein
LKKRRFSGLRKQPSASFADAVLPHDNTAEDAASVATDMAPLLGEAASSPPRKMRSPFKTSSSFKLNGDKLSFKMGMSRGDRSEASALASRRKRWKPSKVPKIPSKINLTSNSRSYDSFATSRGTPSPPAHVEALGVASSQQNFMEYTFDFDEGACFFTEPSTPNHFKNLKCDEEMKPFLTSSTTSSESTPPPPLPPLIEPFFFFSAFHPIAKFDGFDEPKLDEAMDDISEQSSSNESEVEHVMSTSAGIKFFESLSPTSLTFPSSRSSKSPRSYDIMVHEDDCDTDSQSSMPSINGRNNNDGSSRETDEIVFQPDIANDKEMSDSVLAWTLLGAVMGSPAPQSIQFAKKNKEHTNLWTDEDTTDTSDNELPSLFDDECNEGSFIPELNTPETEQFDNILPSLAEEADCDSLSIPDMLEDCAMPALTPHKSEDATDAAIAWGALAIFLGSPAPSCVRQTHKAAAKNLWADDTIDEMDELISLDASENDGPIDECSIPDLSNHVDLNDDLSFSGLECDGEDSYALPKDDEDATNAAIMWTALSALLSSPAPSCVRKKKETPQAEHFLFTDSNAENDDIMSLAQLESVVDELDEVTLDYPGSEEDELNINLSDLQIDCDELNNTHTVEPSQKTEDITTSTLAWGALAAFLGSPAPSCIIQKNCRHVTNLWRDEAINGNDDLVSLANSDVNDSASIPSLVAESQVDSAPSSPLIRNALSFESVSSQNRDNVSFQTSWAYS